MGLAHWMALSVSAIVAPVAPAREVVWVDLSGVPALARQAARREADAVLARVGLMPRWRLAGPRAVTGPGELVVVLLREDRSAMARGGARVLGACLARSSGRMWIFLENVAWAMGLERLEDLAGADMARVGRAVGRIVAHELIHAVAPDIGHAPSGIMAARLDRRDLLASRLDVDPETVRGLRRALLPRRASSAPPTR